MGTTRAIDTEFSELLATAIENAEAREAVRRLAEEQGALRRVATLVAENPESADLFSAIAREVAYVLDVRGVIVDRFEADGSQVTLGSAYDPELASAEAFLGVGARMPLQPGKLAAAVQETRQAARVDDYSKLDLNTGAAARAAGIGSGCAAPIFVDGELWGQICVFSASGKVLPADTEYRLDEFAKLVATAISNHEARVALRVLADEQAALRRVATLVANSAPPTEIFPAVCEEVGRLLDADLTWMATFLEDGTATTIAEWSAGVGPIGHAGTRLRLEPGSILARISETREAVRRVRGYADETGGEIGELPRSMQLESTVGAPILVESRLWGACIAATRRGSSSVEDAEARLVEFTELVATAIANAKSQSELAASRRRIVAASDAARRRIERDLHDGVQQQLISLGLHIATLEAGLPAGDQLTEELANVRNRLRLGLEALGEIARGIHPAILRHGGLAPALGALARGSRVPVALDTRIDVQLPEEVEVAAYYVVSEALTNVTKHARASDVHIDVSTDHPALTLVVRDDGIGGAAVGDGSGLVGLQDRVEALGGRITVDSPPGRGTSIVVALPTASEPSSPIENALGPPNEL